jgi:hypothetical protein
LQAILQPYIAQLLWICGAISLTTL